MVTGARGVGVSHLDAAVSDEGLKMTSNKVQNLLSVDCKRGEKDEANTLLLVYKCVAFVWLQWRAKSAFR